MPQSTGPYRSFANWLQESAFEPSEAKRSAMKHFQFQLQRVLELRSQQAEVERARLQSLLNGRTRFVRDRDNLLQQKLRAATDIRSAQSISGSDLCALASFDRYVQKRRAVMDKQLAQLDKQIGIQTAALRESERKVKLLEKLKERRLIDWTAERDKELEAAAAESYLARFLNDRRGLTRVDATPSGELPALTE
jgi:flagellar export protein FliJ